MSKPVNTTLLGAFVTGAIVLIAFAIIALGGEGLFTKSERVIMYFSGNVDGLNVGAPVNVRGVRIGTVREIDIEFNTETGELRVPVIAEIEADSIETVRTLNADDPLDAIIRELGLRAQLQIQSILTSQLFIQLDYHPNTEINYHGDGSLLEIPTIPMMFEQLDNALEDVSLEQMVVDLSSSLNAISRLVNSSEIQETLQTMKQAFNSVDNLSKDMHSKLGNLTDNTNQAMSEIQASITDLRQLLADARSLVAEDSPQVRKLDTALDEITNAARTIRDLEQLPQMQRLDDTLGEISAAARAIGTFEDSPQMYNLNTALEEISAAARAMRILADTLERHPESLLRGKNLQE